MNNEYEISVDIKPVDKFKKAEQDLLQALTSLIQLTPYEQRLLASRIFGAAQVDLVIRMVEQYNTRSN